MSSSTAHTGFPDFLIIGAAKSGTTSLAAYLQQHPNLRLPEHELNFFTFARNRFRYTVQNHGYIDQLDKYLSFFKQTGVLHGEKSVSYLYKDYCKEVIRNIEHYHPHPEQLKLIALLRHPVDRAFSQYVHNLNFHENLPFEKAIEAWEKRKNNGWVPAYDYLGASVYSEPLKEFKKRFPHLGIYFFQDLKNHTDSLLRSVFRFLEVDEEALPANRKQVYNRSHIPNNEIIKIGYRLAVRCNPIRPVLNRMLSVTFRAKLKQGVQGWTHHKPKLKPELRKKLLTHFTPEIRQLEKVLQRDLSPWLEKEPA